MKSSHSPRYTLASLALVSSMVAAASGQQVNAVPEPEASSAGGVSVVVKTKAGDSLDKLIGAQYKNSPLKIETLRGVVQAANPNIAGTGTRLKPGQEIVLPAHKDIVAAVLGTLMPAAAPAETRQEPETTQRRDWIRYP